MHKVKSYGKINLSLEILGKREDGYHNIDTLMNSIDLWDEIRIEQIVENKLILESDNPNFPIDENNLIYKAWDILRKFKKIDTGLKITVKKNIPIAAGLAGGTSNACEVMKALNKIWDLEFDNKTLVELAKPLGADSTFFFFEGLLRGENIGDKITKVRDSLDYPLILINPGIQISSKEVYSKISKYTKGKVENLVENINSDDFLLKNAFNSMEDISFHMHPELEKIKKDLKDCKADLSLMSGSGPTVYGIFKDDKVRDLVYTKLSNKYKYVIKSKMI